MLYIQPVTKAHKETTAIAEMIASDCLAQRARRIDRVITRIYDQELKSSGLRGTQLNTLVALCLMKTARPGQLIKAIQVEKSTLSRNIARLESLGFVQVTLLPDGGQELSLSAAGMRALTQAQAGWERAQKRVQELLGASALPTLDRFARRLKDQ